jgi:RES domain-containing protein
MSGLVRPFLVRHKSTRLIASRYPTVGIFDDLTSDPDDLRAAFALEARTSPKLVTLQLLPDKEILTGPGASIIMAAFLYASEDGGRFNTGDFGAWYAGLELETAVAETLYHNTRRLQFSAGGFPNRIQMRELTSVVNTELVDIRGQMAERPQLYHLTDYSGSQPFASACREGGANGVAYDSVRKTGGTNVCLFWPSVVPQPVLQGDHYEYVWDAKGEVSVSKLTSVEV